MLLILLCIVFVDAEPSISSRASLPEESMTAPEIISYYGYTVEMESTTTPDGYILQLHRIPHGKNESSSSARPVAFLQHGLLASSADWVSNPPHQSLAFLLADAGFDVWMGNVRGNVYSKRHTRLQPTQQQFWQFTFDEISSRDLPTMIDHVLNATGQDSLHYVGHSQGTLIMFARLSEDETFSKKIKNMFALAPVASVGNIQGLLRIIGSQFLNKKLNWLLRMVGDHEFLPSTWFSKLISKLVCGMAAVMNPLCQNVLFQIGGPETNQFNQSRLMVYMTHTPAGTSTANILHWSQMVASGRTQMYDWGSDAANIEHYGQSIPPVYDISKVNAPVHLYYSDADWLADSIDVQRGLLNVIPSEWLRAARKLRDFNHFDFIYGLRARSEIYEEVISTIREFEKGRGDNKT